MIKNIFKIKKYLLDQIFLLNKVKIVNGKIIGNKYLPCGWKSTNHELYIDKQRDNSIQNTISKNSSKFFLYVFPSDFI